MILKAYHGTNSRFDRFDKSKARIRNDLYGGGIAYFTDSLDIGKSYARTMSKKDGIPIVYEVELNLKKTFDVSHIFTGSELTKFLENIDVEQFARGARLLQGGSRLETISNLKSGKVSLTGDLVFRGLSNGMNQTAKARAILERMGYDSLRYNGDMMEMTATKHNVYLAYNPISIDIKQRYIVKPPGDVMHTKENFIFV